MTGVCVCVCVCQGDVCGGSVAMGVWPGVCDHTPLVTPPPHTPGHIPPATHPLPENLVACLFRVYFHCVLLGHLAFGQRNLILNRSQMKSCFYLMYSKVLV